MAAMVIDMNETPLCALEQLKAFLQGTGGGRAPALRRALRTPPGGAQALWLCKKAQAGRQGSINAFCAAHLNLYLNFHRPCLFAENVLDAKGKRKKRYPQRLVITPPEKLASLPDTDSVLKPGVTLAQLQTEATRLTDNEAAQQLNEAKRRLFQSIHPRPKCAACSAELTWGRPRRPPRYPGLLDPDRLRRGDPQHGFGAPPDRLQEPQRPLASDRPMLGVDEQPIETDLG